MRQIFIPHIHHAGWLWHSHIALFIGFLALWFQHSGPACFQITFHSVNIGKRAKPWVKIEACSPVLKHGKGFPTDALVCAASRYAQSKTAVSRVVTS